MDRRLTNELLLYCLCLDPDGTGDIRLQRLSTSDWANVIQQSNRYGVTPLLYHRLKTLHPSTPIPPDVMQKLQQIYLLSTYKNIKLYHKLGKVLKILRQENIAVIALKGAHLAELVYGNIALRPMGDVDLLLHREDLERADALFLEMGFNPRDCNRVVGKKNKHFNYFQPNQGFCVEVHWNILIPIYSFDIDIDGQWERSRPAIVGGVEVSVLCPEDLLLHLCLHNSEHTFDMGIRSICDLSEVIRHYNKEIDWGQFRLRTQKWGVGKCVYLNLRIAKELLRAGVPDELLKGIKPNNFNERFVAIAMEQIFPNEVRTSHGLFMSSNIAQLWGNKRLLEKIKIFLKTTFQSREVMTLTYPPSSNSLRIYFYYPVRIVVLFKRYGQAVWHILRRDRDMVARTKQQNEATALKEWLMSA